MKKIILLSLIISLVNYSEAQDTLKVGLNDQMIQVDVPESGQKITVLIEDTAFTYKVEISKMDNRSLENKMKEISQASRNGKVRYSSSWFRSGEVGFNSLAFKSINLVAESPFQFFLDDSLIDNSMPVHYTRRSFSSSGKYWGAYLDFTIRERERASKRIEKLYLKRKSHIRLDYNSVVGEVKFDNYFGNGNILQDSFLTGTSRAETVSFTNLQLSQLFAYGYTFNESKKIALEYGVNVGIQFTLSETNNDKVLNIGNENTLNNFTLFDDYVANPFIRIQHHAAYNYGPYSVNAKLTYLPKRFGSSEQVHAYGNILSLGLGYKF